MESHPVSDPGSDARTQPVRLKRQPAARIGGQAAGWLLLAFVLLLGLPARQAPGHWISPEEIVARLQADPQLRQVVGVRSVRRQGRILLIAVDPEAWRKVPRLDRLKLANEWQQLWSHNVHEGIVAILSANDERPLVNYNARGEARLLDAQ